MSKSGSVASRSKKTRMMSILFSVLASTMIAAVPPAGAKSLKEVLESREDLSVFTQALQQSPLWDRLGSQNLLTIFVPSNAGMREERSSFLLQEILLTDGNKSRLWDRMALHMVPGVRRSTEGGSQRSEINTLAALCISIQVSGEKTLVGPEALVTEHIAADNGSLLVIDRMLWRPWNGGDHCDSPPLEQTVD